jgi:ribonucleoside-diphosphate reductase subunit M1
MYHRRVLSGEFIVVNKHIVRDLERLGLWDETMKNEIIQQRGSVQSIARIPEDLRDIYRTVWEIPQRDLVGMCGDRGVFIDQSQSFNVHMESPTFAKLTSLHFYAWKSGLKTGMYYLRSQPATNPIQFTVEKQECKKTSCNGNDKEDMSSSSSCVACSC